MNAGDELLVETLDLTTLLLIMDCTLCMYILLLCYIWHIFAYFSALAAGYKLFIMQYIYTRFPRYKQRHDATRRLWKSLPTDADLEEQYHTQSIDRVSIYTPSLHLPPPAQIASPPLNPNF